MSLHYDPRGNNPFVSIEPADEMPITNIRFENIRINHEGQQPLIEVRPQACPPWSDTDRPGRISDVFFKDIVVPGNFNGIYGKVWVSGVDGAHAVNNVIFDNLVRHGVVTRRTSPEVVIGGYASNIQFTGIGAIPAPAPAPAPTPSGTFTLTLEAEKMPTRTTGGMTSNGWNIWSNGYAEQTVAFPSTGTHVFDVVAKGRTAAGIWPMMELRIDGSPRGSLSVTRTTFATYRFTVPSLTAGSHRVAVAFTNYAYVPPEERGLLVDKIMITSSAPAPTGTNSQIIERLYVDILDRASDPGGLAYWVGQLNNGVSLQTIRGRFAGSTEGVARIHSLYQAARGRNATSAELSAEIAFLTNGGTTAQMQQRLRGETPIGSG